MKCIKIILSLLVGISVLSIGLIGYAEPKIATDLSKQINKLSSSNPIERGLSAYNIGKMGTKAASAIPHLINLL